VFSIQLGDRLLFMGCKKRYATFPGEHKEGMIWNALVHAIRIPDPLKYFILIAELTIVFAMIPDNVENVSWPWITVSSRVPSRLQAPLDAGKFCEFSVLFIFRTGKTLYTRDPQRIQSSSTSLQTPLDAAGVIVFLSRPFAGMRFPFAPHPMPSSQCRPGGCPSSSEPLPMRPSSQLLVAV
jgi:hypothetical protein